ncbi:MAG: hypothetical protein AABX51_08205 [Nanoarchaeota archaeon]
MNCFDHGKEFTGLCGWCGKQVCPGCIGRQDGRKKYCRDCAAKMGNFKSGESSFGKTVEEQTPIHHDEEQPKITPIAQKRPAVAFGPTKHVDPRHFELDDVDDHPRRTAAPPVHIQPHRIEPQINPQNPIGLRVQPEKIVHDDKPKPQVGSAMGSNRYGSPEAARAAFGMLAQQAKTTSAAPQTESKPHLQTGSTVQKNAGTGAASKAFSFLADAAKETAKK